MPLRFCVTLHSVGRKTPFFVKNVRRIVAALGMEKYEKLIYHIL